MSSLAVREGETGLEVSTEVLSSLDGGDDTLVDGDLGGLALGGDDVLLLLLE